MRACAVCFFYRGEAGAGEGACLIEPPTVFLVHDAEGQATFISMRPTVPAQDFCWRFSHRAGPKPALAPVANWTDPEPGDDAGDDPDGEG